MMTRTSDSASVAIGWAGTGLNGLMLGVSMQTTIDVLQAITLLVGIASGMVAIANTLGWLRKRRNGE